MIRLLRALSSLIQLLLLLFGPPVVLAWWAGWPLPRHWPTNAEWNAGINDPLTRTTITDGFVCLMWLVWSSVIYLLIRDIATRLSRRHIRRPRWQLAAPLQTVVSSLIGSTVLAITSITGRGVAAGTSTHGSMAPPIPAGAPATTTTIDAAAPVPSGQLMVLTAGQHYTYTVRHGDTLWHVADTWLDDPHRWTEIYQLNRDQYDQHGRMHHGDHIEPGWILVLPDDATPPASAVPVPPPGHAPTSSAPGPATPTPPALAAPSPGSHTATSPAPTAPAQATAPAPGADTTTSPAPSAADETPSPSGDHGGLGAELGEHGWVAAPTAAAVAAAAALVWIHRRRRYRPRPPGPARRSDPDLTPLPLSIAALHQARPDTTASEDDMDQSESAPEAHEAATVTAAALGVRDTSILRLPDLPAHGVALDGPGAHAAGRGVLAAVLSAGGPWASDDEAIVITTTADMATLLGADTTHQDRSDRLAVSPTLADALNDAERHLLRRARIASEGSDDLTDPPEPGPSQPPIVILTAAPSGAMATRLVAILTVGARLGIYGVFLGQAAGAATWYVNTDGTSRTGDGADGPRLNVLDTTATIDILNTLNEARPVEQDSATAPAAPKDTSPNGSQPTPAPTTPPATSPPAQHPQPPEADNPRPATNPKPRLRLTVLGKPSLSVVSDESSEGVWIRRRDGMQILVRLAVEPDGATSDQLMAALWPEVRPRFSRKRFHTTISEMRTHLTELLDADPVPRTDERYHLDPDHVDVDLWALNATIDKAATALEPAEHTTALTAIIDMYTGNIADGHSWLWLAPYREATRRHILDAHVALADSEPEPRQALTHIQNAIRLDPYNEDLYQRAMHLHARLANPDGVRRTLRALSERLAELEIRVTPQTQQVATQLLDRIGARERAGHSSP